MERTGQSVVYHSAGPNHNAYIGGMMATQNDTTIDAYQRVIDLQTELEEIEGVASLAAEAGDDNPLSGTLNPAGCHEGRCSNGRY